MKPKTIEAKISFNDIAAGEEILSILKAPVTKKNIAQLKVFVEELGEMFAEKYETMLREITDEKLAVYDCRCPCGRKLKIDVFKNIFEGGYKV